MIETYADTDVIFLQEAAAVFIEQMGMQLRRFNFTHNNRVQ